MLLIMGKDWEQGLRAYFDLSSHMFEKPELEVVSKLNARMSVYAPAFDHMNMTDTATTCLELW